jgi:hypothetical protein
MAKLNVAESDLADVVERQKAVISHRAREKKDEIDKETGIAEREAEYVAWFAANYSEQIRKWATLPGSGCSYPQDAGELYSAARITLETLVKSMKDLGSQRFRHGDLYEFNSVHKDIGFVYRHGHGDPVVGYTDVCYKIVYDFLSISGKTGSIKHQLERGNVQPLDRLFLYGALDKKENARHQDSQLP